MPILTSVAAGTLAFVGALVGAVLTRRSTLEQERSRRREETMRLMRWAVELALAESATGREVGLQTLRALARSHMVNREDLGFVDEIARSVITIRRR